MTEKAKERALELKGLADEIASRLRCNCDLDNWQPEQSTGHSWVCRIHKAAIEKFEYGE